MHVQHSCSRSLLYVFMSCNIITVHLLELDKITSDFYVAAAAAIATLLFYYSTYWLFVALDVSFHVQITYDGAHTHRLLNGIKQCGSCHVMQSMRSTFENIVRLCECVYVSRCAFRLML